MSPAQFKDGRFARAKSPHSKQCQHIRDDGTQCRAWSLKGELFCRFHAMSPEQVAEAVQAGVRARRAQAAKRRMAKELSRRGSSVPVDLHAVALERLAAAEAQLQRLVEEGRMSPDELPRVLVPASGGRGFR